MLTKTNMKFLAIILFLATNCFAAYADEKALCVQEYLNGIGFETGTPDGVIGRNTKKAAAEYRIRYLPKGLPEFSANSAEDWCDFLSSKHTKMHVGGNDFYKAAKHTYAPNVWETKVESGMPFRISGKPPTANPEKILIYIHGDDMLRTTYNARCDRFAQYLHDTSLLICIWRTTHSSKARRTRKEIDLVNNTIKRIGVLWPDAKISCDGHSGGGHNCVSAAQSENIDFECLVASAPALSVRLWHKLKGWGMPKGRYDPIDYVANTSADKIIIVGDARPGSDKNVNPEVWEHFVNRAEQKNLPVKYVKIVERGHKITFEGLKEAINCLNGR